MDLGEALYQMFTGGRESVDEPEGFRASLDYLAQDYTSVSAMSRDLGVPRSTLRGWLGGRTPRSAPSGISEEAQYRFRRDALSRDRERAMRRDWSTDSLVVVGTYTYDAKARQQEQAREVRLGDYLNDIGEDLATAFLDGATPEELETIVVDNISDGGWYHDSFQDGDWDVESVNWL